MRYLSICSGIEAASTAWHPLGWEPVGFSEIEPFPSAVLAHHWPHVPNLGDMTRFDEWENLHDVDLLVGGTPCQAFSVAGLRNSLDDDRGNLTLTFVKILEKIDYDRTTKSLQPSITLWENVPGVLSTKDNAFGCFLGALAGEDLPLLPAGGKWSNAGAVYGPKRAIAWRVLDAQYFGVAQRRRRVFVIASARDGFDPSKILFEFEGLRRDTPPSREAKKGTAQSLIPSLTSSSQAVDGISETQKQDSAVAIPAVAGTLDTQCGGGKLTHQSVTNGHIIGTITARMFNALGSRDVEEGALLPVFLDPYNQQTNSHTAKTLAARSDMDGSGVIAYTLNNKGFDNSKDATDLVTETYALAGNTIDRKPENGGNGSGFSKEVCYTLTKMDKHAVAFGFEPGITEREGNPSRFTEERSPTLRANMGDNQAAVVKTIAVAINGDVAGTLDANYHKGAGSANFGEREVVAVAVAMRESGQGYWMQDDIAGTLRAEGENRPSRPSHVIGQPPVMAVRRLTPTECERLQGFPDGHTLIPWRGKPADQCPDGPRYKALGNSMAVPVMAWIGQRINNYTPHEKRH